MKLDDETGSIYAIKWNYSYDLKRNDLIDIAYNIEINNWKNNNTLQLNIIDIKKYNNIIDLQIHKRNYKCQLTNDMNILITNSQGQSISSDLSKNSNDKQEFFTKKILSFAEIALGETA